MKPSSASPALRVALIGLGRQGQQHLTVLRNIEKQKLITLVGVCDLISLPDTAAIQFRDYKKLVEQTSPDLVIIATPNTTHYEISEFCLTHGCDVLKEKPLAMTLEDAQKLIRIAHAHKQLLLTTQQRFFYPSFQEAKKAIAQLGEVKAVSYYLTLNDTKPSWYWHKADGGGTWLNLGWHAVDVLQWMLGSATDITIQSEFGGKRDWEYDTDHSTTAQITLQENIPVSVFVSCVEPKSEYLKIIGKEATLILSRKSLEINDRKQVTSALFPDKQDVAYSDQYQEIFSLLKERSSRAEEHMQRSLATLRTIEKGFTFLQNSH
jgi:predicted dehydrogenase